MTAVRSFILQDPGGQPAAASKKTYVYLTWKFLTWQKMLGINKRSSLFCWRKKVLWPWYLYTLKDIDPHVEEDAVEHRKWHMAQD